MRIWEWPGPSVLSETRLLQASARWRQVDRSFLLRRLHMSVCYCPHMPSIWAHMWHVTLGSGCPAASSEEPKRGSISRLRELYWNADFARDALCFGYFWKRTHAGTHFAHSLSRGSLSTSFGSAEVQCLRRLWKCFDHGYAVVQDVHFCPSRRSGSCWVTFVGRKWQ